ncbi:threonine synthase [Marinicella rhabdoformis]|uniref:threonine synthase n=1 Tax=Marinicella rhabdoformis TaxID=2580566 RepID=UPI0012AECD5F|nr:threonine synthase [Marinicella rhabdoformis]
MKLYNLKERSQSVNFDEAIKMGLGRDQGLFFPEKIPRLTNMDELLRMPVFERNVIIHRALIGDALTDEQLNAVVEKTYDTPVKLRPLDDKKGAAYCLELFHGPTLAFKDFGAKYMANCLSQISNQISKESSSNNKITILTATSGDTGAAVAQAFYGLENIDVVVLFPKGKISELQQKMFTTLGENIRTVAIDGAFDDCQKLVKQCFDDAKLVQSLGLNSANSINISRLYAQVCYYFDAIGQLSETERENVVVAVPSGNFGNLTAGIIAKCLGLPIKRFIAATNANDTVPRYLETGQWQPNETVETLSNAMDVSQPNNWPRIEYLVTSGQFDADLLNGVSVTESQTAEAMKQMQQQGYISEPHAAVAYHGLNQSLVEGETGLFLGTAHPAKFKSSVEDILSIELPLPAEIDAVKDKADLSVSMKADIDALKTYLLR